MQEQVMDVWKYDSITKTMVLSFRVTTSQTCDEGLYIFTRLRAQRICTKKICQIKVTGQYMWLMLCFFNDN